MGDKSDASERIVACIAVEKAIADVYNEFSNKFDDARDFFFELSREEINHATVLEVAAGYEMIGKLPESMTPTPMSNIYSTLDLINATKEKIKATAVTLPEALDMSLAMESSKVESYLIASLKEETEDKVIANLRKLLVDERSHIEKISEFMKSLANEAGA